MLIWLLEGVWMHFSILKDSRKVCWEATVIVQETLEIVIPVGGISPFRTQDVNNVDYVAMHEYVIKVVSIDKFDISFYNVLPKGMTLLLNDFGNHLLSRGLHDIQIVRRELRAGDKFLEEYRKVLNLLLHSAILCLFHVCE